MALAPAPIRSPIADPRDFVVGDTWLLWFLSVKSAVDAAAQRLGIVTLAGQAATIPATAVPTPTLTTARYRVNYYLRVTQPATTSSSMTVTIGWTDGGVACSQSFAPVTGNTTSTTQNGSLVIRADQGTTITYAMAYSSTGATPMQYSLDVDLQILP